jgi:hypothetical protein
VLEGLGGGGYGDGAGVRTGPGGGVGYGEVGGEIACDGGDGVTGFAELEGAGEAEDAGARWGRCEMWLCGRRGRAHPITIMCYWVDIAGANFG